MSKKKTNIDKSKNISELEMDEDYLPLEDYNLCFPKHKHCKVCGKIIGLDEMTYNQRCLYCYQMESKQWFMTGIGILIGAAIMAIILIKL